MSLKAIVCGGDGGAVRELRRIAPSCDPNCAELRAAHRLGGLDLELGAAADRRADDVHRHRLGEAERLRDGERGGRAPQQRRAHRLVAGERVLLRRPGARVDGQRRPRRRLANGVGDEGGGDEVELRQERQRRRRLRRAARDLRHEGAVPDRRPAREVRGERREHRRREDEARRRRAERLRRARRRAVPQVRARRREAERLRARAARARGGDRLDRLVHVRVLRQHVRIARRRRDERRRRRRRRARRRVGEEGGDGGHLESSVAWAADTQLVGNRGRLARSRSRRTSDRRREKACASRLQLSPPPPSLPTCSPSSA